MLTYYLVCGVVFALMVINAAKFYMVTKQKGSFGKIIKDHWRNYIWGLAAGALSACGFMQLFHRVFGLDSYPALSKTLKEQTLSPYAANALGGLFCLFLAYEIVKRLKKPPSERLFDFLFFFGVLAMTFLL